MHQKFANKIYRKLLITVTMFLPGFGKLALIASHIVFLHKYKIPVILIFLPIVLAIILSSKMLFVGFALRDLFWLIKPFGLIVGGVFGKYLVELSTNQSLSGIKSYKKYVGLAIIFIALLQWYGVDIWTGSGSFGARATGGFRGFGELAFFVFFLSVSNYLILSLALCVLSASKIVILATLLGLFVNLRYRRSSFHVIVSSGILALILWLVFGADLTFIKDYSTALYYSVFGCGWDCSSFANRTSQTLDFSSQFSENLYFLFGSTESGLFTVSPEIAVLFYYKLYGIFGILPFVVFYYYFRNFLWANCILVLILLDVYMLSPIGYIILGIIVGARFQLDNWVRNSSD